MCPVGHLELPAAGVEDDRFGSGESGGFPDHRRRGLGGLRYSARAGSREDQRDHEDDEDGRPGRRRGHHAILSEGIDATRPQAHSERDRHHASRADPRRHRHRPWVQATQARRRVEPRSSGWKRNAGRTWFCITSASWTARRARCQRSSARHVSRRRSTGCAARRWLRRGSPAATPPKRRRTRIPAWLTSRTSTWRRCSARRTCCGMSRPPRRSRTSSLDLEAKVAHCRRLKIGMGGTVVLRVNTRRDGVDVKNLEVQYIPKFFEFVKGATATSFPGASSPVERPVPPGRYVLWAISPRTGERSARQARGRLRPARSRRGPVGDLPVTPGWLLAAVAAIATAAIAVVPLTPALPPRDALSARVLCALMAVVACAGFAYARSLKAVISAAIVVVAAAGAIGMLLRTLDAGSTCVADYPGGARIIGRESHARRGGLRARDGNRLSRRSPARRGRQPRAALDWPVDRALPVLGGLGRAAADCLAGRVCRGNRRASTLPLRCASPRRADRAVGEPPYPDLRRVPQLPPHRARQDLRAAGAGGA